MKTIVRVKEQKELLGEKFKKSPFLEELLAIRDLMLKNDPRRFEREDEYFVKKQTYSG